MNFSTILTQAIEIASEAGACLRQVRQERSFQVSYKGALDLVTEADLASERIIVDRIAAAFPDHRILSEEGSPDFHASLARGPLWIVDPLDGTTNFANGLQQVAVSLAFALDGVVHCAVVYNPFTEELWTGLRGVGAWRNDEPITCSRTTELTRSLIATGFPYARDHVPELMGYLEQVLLTCQDVRRFGAASLDMCWVGAGLFGGYYESVQPWDMAAAALIAREAGAVIDHFGPPTKLPNLPIELQGEKLLVLAPGIARQFKEKVFGLATE